MNTISPYLINQLNDALAAIQAAEASIQHLFSEIETLKAPAEPPPPPPAPKGPGYWLDGKWTPKWTAVDVMVCVFTEFSRIDDAFPERFARESINYGRTRKHIARTRNMLYPDRPDLMVHSREFFPGWFIGTNESNATKRRLIRAAADIMGYASKDTFWFRFPWE